MAPNVRVGKYILKNKIGEGAFTEVRYAVHEETGKEYAVKVFDRANLPKGDARFDIKKEIKIMQRLRHPNIVSIHTALVTSSRLYLVMELVCGGELYDEIVSRRRIDEDTSRRYFQQLTDAIVYCHRRGVFHRDLKPENLLLDAKGNLKVTDFGMSWMSENDENELGTQQLLRTQCGTPKYMAPEIINRASQGYDGAKLDAWDCGMVLFVLLAGYMPFNGEDECAVFRSILKGTVKFPKFFSSGAKSVLISLLEKDPNKRASLEEVRQHPWFQINYFEESTVPLSSQNDMGEIKGTDCSPTARRCSQDRRLSDIKLSGSRKKPSRSLLPIPVGSMSRSRHGPPAGKRKEPTRVNVSEIPGDGNRDEAPRETMGMAKPPVHGQYKFEKEKPSGRSDVPSAADEEALRPLTSLWSPLLNNALVISRVISAAGPAESGGPDEESEDDGPVSIRDRISGSTLGSMYKTMRNGLVPRPVKSDNSQPSPATNPESITPLVLAKDAELADLYNSERTKSPKKFRSKNYK